jgi:hypothetical protein
MVLVRKGSEHKFGTGRPKPPSRHEKQYFKAKSEPEARWHDVHVWNFTDIEYYPNEIVVQLEIIE